MKLAVLEADLDGVVEFGYLTIKSRLLFRFLTAKAELGHLWQAMLAKNDPFFNTDTGRDYLLTTRQSLYDPGLSDVDHIERVVVPMEKIAGIDHPTHSRMRRHEIPDADENFPIAYRLLQRFVDARTVLGNDWHSALIASDPFFTTEKGKCYLTSIGRSLSDLKTGPVDHMERVIVAMEKLAGISVKSVV